jgi:YD repeat-containing protein
VSACGRGERHESSRSDWGWGPTSAKEGSAYTYQSGSKQLLTVVDPLSRETEHTYDSLGNRLTTTELVGTADEVTTTYTYDPAYNQVATVPIR